MGIRKSKNLNNRELGNHNYLVWQHQGCQIKKKYLIPLWKHEFAERIGRQTAGNNLQHCYDYSKLQCIEKQNRIVSFIPDITVILYFQILRNPLDRKAEHFQAVLEGG